MAILINLLLFSIAVFVVSTMLPGIRVKSYGTALVVAVVYSILNFFIGWLLVFLALPLIILTFGLFKFAINAFLLWITDKMIEDYEIQGFGTTLLAAFLITIVDSLMKWVLF